MEFKVSHFVFLKVSPKKGVMCFNKKGKLVLRYTRPFEVIRVAGKVVYQLKLPSQLSRLHDNESVNPIHHMWWT